MLQLSLVCAHLHLLRLCASKLWNSQNTAEFGNLQFMELSHTTRKATCRTMEPSMSTKRVQPGTLCFVDCQFGNVPQQTYNCEARIQQFSGLCYQPNIFASCCDTCPKYFQNVAGQFPLQRRIKDVWNAFSVSGGTLCAKVVALFLATSCFQVVNMETGIPVVRPTLTARWMASSVAKLVEQVLIRITVWATTTFCIESSDNRVHWLQQANCRKSAWCPCPLRELQMSQCNPAVLFLLRQLQ